MIRLLEVDDTDELRLLTLNEQVGPGTNDSSVVAADGTYARYAILSHRWLADDEEVTYDDVVSGRDVASKRGWQKLQWLRKQALADGYAYAWSDTCCIDKSSSQELSESINSMYRWYQNASCCYVYLHDMPDMVSPPGNPGPLETMSANNDMCHSLMSAASPMAELQSSRDTLAHRSRVDENAKDQPSYAYSASQQNVPGDIDCDSLEKCEWFSRGWTLQEMIAARKVQFYSSTWKLLADLSHRALEISRITGVPSELLSKRASISSYSIAQKLSWAARRRTSKLEDRSYSLLGLLDVNIAIVYGEGSRAFDRLQEEILRTSTDDSIFVFDNDSPFSYHEPEFSSLLARSVDQYANSSNIAARPLRSLELRRECQIFSKEVSFRNYKLVRVRKAGVTQAPYHAVLGCWDETQPSKKITLQLNRQSSHTFTIHSSERIKLLDAYHPGDTTRVQDLSVERQSRGRTIQIHPEPTPRKHVIVCRFAPKTPHFQFHNFIIDGPTTADEVDWQLETQVLVAQPRKCRLEGYLSLCLPETGASAMEPRLHEHSRHTLHTPELKLRIKYHHKDTSNDIICWKFDDDFVTFPEWATSILASYAYQCTMKRYQGGLVVVKFNRQPEGDDYLPYRQCILKVEHMSALRSPNHLLLTTLMLLAAPIALFIKLFIKILQFIVYILLSERGY